MDGDALTGQFPGLLSPIRIGARSLKNRVVMGSMHTRLESEPDGIERQQAFYAERARGGVAMIVTGGFAPNQAGRVEEDAPVLETAEEARALRPIVDSIHAEGALVLLQILHTGRYAKIAQPVGASAIKSPINKIAPRALTGPEVEATIEDYVRCAELARDAGFDGVEIMGSEGYLINQFTAPHTNDRTDEWGGDSERRMRLPLEIVRRTRARLGPDFILMYRISALDLVPGGCTDAEIAELARRVEAAGADILNTGIGWHEARIPTVAYFVPRAAWRSATRRVKAQVKIPVMASNRINMPQVAEDVLSAGDADLISMARPLLADPDFVRKAAAGRSDEINTCIACNQACLDFIFRDKLATCLVNPRAGRELEFDRMARAGAKKRVAVVGAGAAGLACAIQAAERGHEVDVFEAGERIGGQLNYASEVPAKSEFNELKRYFARRVEVLGIRMHLGRRVGADELKRGGYDHVVVATGVRPRVPDIPGIDGPNVILYTDLLSARRQAGARVAVIGAGGIGFDVSAYLLHDAAAAAAGIPEFAQAWGVDMSARQQGGLTPALDAPRHRQVWLLQRSTGKFGRTLGPSTGWILREEVMRRGLQTIGGCEYLRIDARGLHIRVEGVERVLEVDTVVVCAGQESERALYEELKSAQGAAVHAIGGADYAGELDALRAIDQGTRLALSF